MAGGAAAAGCPRQYPAAVADIIAGLAFEAVAALILFIAVALSAPPSRTARTPSPATT